MKHAKTLLSSIDKKTSIPILNNFIVQNGRALSTNMDIWTEAPSALNDGVYKKETLKSGIAMPEIEATIDNFPQLHFKAEKSIFVQAELFFAALKFVVSGVSTEETRYYLCGVFFDVENNKLAATDGHRLFAHEFPISELGASFILPTSAIKTLMTLKPVASGEMEISISYDKMKVQFVLNNIKITSKVIDGKFPDYSRVIPNVKEAPHSFTINPKIFAKQYKTAKLMRTFPRQLIKLQNGKIVVDSENTKIDAPEYKLLPGQGFNARYIDDAAKAWGETITFRSLDAHSPVVANDCGRTLVVMPMRV